MPEPPDDDRRFVNNPFARALHPPKARRTLAQRIALAVVSIVGAAIMGAAFLLPLAFGWSLFGSAHGRVGMIAAGVVVAAIYALIVASLVRRRKR